ncbi:MAG: hypothetical protein QOJ72_2515, partial [Nocardioidaceae bacterium]|nr:hypothetical protein [Nocardioidaceae bacterium]
MSGYTIGEIVVWLVLAAVLGFALGWLLRELKCRSQHGAGTAAAADPQRDAPTASAVESAGFA